MDNDELLRRIAPLIQNRIVTLCDAPKLAGFFFRFIPPKVEDLIIKGLPKNDDNE